MAESHSAGQGEAGRRLPSGFADLISPMQVAEFTSQHWEREHLILHRGSPDHYVDLLTLADMDHLIATARVRSSDLRIVADGEPTPVSALVPEIGNGAHAREAVYAEYRKGATLSLLFLEQHWNPLDQLCQSMTELFGGLVHVNSYLTPAGTRGLTEHYDTHDVFVAQIYGTKRWRLYGQPYRLPLREQRYKRPDEGPGEPVADFNLEPGDLLYMPRGTVHQAVSNDRASLHLTFGVTTSTWAELLTQAVSKAVESDVRFRESVPLGFTTEEEVRQKAERHAGALLRKLAESIRPDAVLSTARRQAVLARKPALAGHLLDLESLPFVDLNTKLVRRPHLLWSLNERPDGAVGLEFNGKEVSFPGHIADELRYLTETELLTGRELPGNLDDSGRLVLIRRLIREGFLTLPGTAGAKAPAGSPTTG